MLNSISHTTAPVTVVSTIARKSLGVCCREIFRQGVHLEEDKVWDMVEGIWRVDNQMKWYLLKVCYDSTTPSPRLSSALAANANQGEGG
jgi:hypothetical protein